MRPLCCGNGGAGINQVLDLGSDGSRGACELREGGGWVIDVTVRILQSVEGGTLVFVQRDTVLDAQWQIGLESGESQGSIDHGSMDENSRWRDNDVQRRSSHP